MADIVLDHIDKIYDNGYHAITDLNLEIADGEFMVMVGPSGCGKSTALRMVAGLEDISEGELRIGGERMNEKAPRDRDIAMVFQSYALYPHLSVFDNIAFGLKLRKLPKADVKDRVERAAATLDLTEYLDRRPKALSGGQRQRVAMGRAIVREPRAFLMDEPLSNLDAKLRGQMRAEIAKLQNELGVTTMYVTHDQVEAMTMGDRVAVIDKGVLQQVASPRDLYLDPDNIFVAGFMGSPPMNMALATIERDGDGMVAVLDGSRVAISPVLLERRPGLAGYVGREVAMGIRPEDVKECEEHRDWPQDQRLTVTVDLVEALGSGIEIHFPVAARKVQSAQTQAAEEARAATNAVGADVDGDGEADDSMPSAIAGPAAAANMWVGMFGPRSFVRLAETIEVGLDTAQAYFFDLDTGAAIRS
jgi:multiple sugar transport system ATP-binding protein